MAAVFTVILIPIVAAVGFMSGVVDGDLTAGSVLAWCTFVLLSGGVFIALLNMMRDWEQTADE